MGDMQKVIGIEISTSKFLCFSMSLNVGYADNVALARKNVPTEKVMFTVG